MKFNELGIKPEVLKAIDDLGFTEATKIQSEIIPLIMDGYDVIGQAQTGTGKTLAFSVSLLSKLNRDTSGVKVLVLSPTRELAIQINEEITKLSKYSKLKSTCVYGSSRIEDQIRAIRNNADIVIGTPGRVMDLMKRNVLKLENLQFFVLDEADEMLNMGFREDLETIFKKTGKEKQVLLFSATMPRPIKTLAKHYMNQDYMEISVVEKIKTAKNIEQRYYITNDSHRVEALCRVLDKENPAKGLLFTKTKRNADELLEKLNSRGYIADIIHGDIPQSGRIATLERFKKGAFQYLIATDVAARGIHVDDINLVVNYNLPQDNESYVHRIGRTGRAGKSGLAITFVTPREERTIGDIERHIQTPLTKAELPTKEDVISSRYNKIIESINSLPDEKNIMFDEYINTLDQEEIKNIVKNLLIKEVSMGLGGNFEKDLTVKDNRKKGRTTVGNATRVFMTLGSKDNVRKKEAMSFVEKNAGIPKGMLFRVEVMPKFTFMNVDNKYADQVISKVNNTKYKGRTIKIEKANN